MNNKLLMLVLGIIGIALIILGIGFMLSRSQTTDTTSTTPTNIDSVSMNNDIKNASYTIEGKNILLSNGRSEVSVLPNSTLKITTTYFGNEAVGDLNQDGLPDTAFSITQNMGGSEIFYYVVVALKTSTGGYRGTNAILLGDRIAPQTIEIKDGVLSVNYSVRKVGEPMTATPSVRKTMWIKFDSKTNQIVEWMKNSEGEVSPSVMKLNMHTWHWQSTTYNNSQTVVPKLADKFTLAFTSDTGFSAATDCNGVGGEYQVNGSNIIFTRMISTMMFCEGSQEKIYSGMLGEVKSYRFTSKGELILNLKTNGGQMIFK